MVRLRVADFKQALPNDESACLEWLKATRYPNGIECRVCKKITKHHKVSKRRCYVCGSCGNHIYPTAGTIFHKSSTPLSIWFKVIRQMQSTDHVISAREIQRGYHLSYKRACHLVKKIREFLDENGHNLINSNQTGNTNITVFNNDVCNPVVKQIRKFVASTNSSDLVNVHSYQDRNDDNANQKSDRIARLLRLQMLLWQNSRGMKIEEIAQKCAISKKTVYRDLKTLELNLKIPLWEEKGRRGIVEGYFLPPINFTVSEAMNIFLAARMMSQLTPEYNLNIISTYLKLSKIAPEPLRNYIQCTIDFLEKQPKDARAKSNFEKLTQSWLLRHKIKICYQELFDSDPVEYIIEPYFIEPVPFVHSCVVIANCHSSKSIKAFKMEQIVGDIIIEPDIFIIPADFNPIEYINSAWGFQVDDQISTVKLQLKPRINKFLLYPSSYISELQSYHELQKDGSKIVTIKVRDVTRFCRWIIRFYDEITVLEPESLRNQIRKTAEEILNVYPLL